MKQQHTLYEWQHRLRYGPPPQRREAAQQLLSFRDKKAGMALLKALYDDDEEVRQQATLSLLQRSAEEGSDALSLLFGQAIPLWGTFDHPLAQRPDDHTLYTIREQLVSFLASWGETLFPAIAHLLQKPWVMVGHRYALKILAQIPSTANLPLLLGALDSLDTWEWRVNRELLRALGALGPQARPAIPLLLQLLPAYRPQMGQREETPHRWLTRYQTAVRSDYNLGFRRKDCEEWSVDKREWLLQRQAALLLLRLGHPTTDRLRWTLLRGLIDVDIHVRLDVAHQLQQQANKLLPLVEKGLKRLLQNPTFPPEVDRRHRNQQLKEAQQRTGGKARGSREGLPSEEQQLQEARDALPSLSQLAEEVSQVWQALRRYPPPASPSQLELLDSFFGLLGTWQERLDLTLYVVSPQDLAWQQQQLEEGLFDS